MWFFKKKKKKEHKKEEIRYSKCCNRPASFHYELPGWQCSYCLTRCEIKPPKIKRRKR